MEDQPKKVLKPKYKVIITVVIILLLLVFLFRFLTGPVNTRSKSLIDVEIAQGTSTSKIAEILKEKELIRSSTMFKIYSKLGSNKSLQAGVYQFTQSMSLKEIVDELGNGSTYNPNLVILTFKEGERLTDYAETIAKGTNHTYQDVISKVNDVTYLSELIDKYCHSNEDNYMMELLAKITKTAITANYLHYEDLYYLNEEELFKYLHHIDDEILKNYLNLFKTVKKNNIPLMEMANIKARVINPLVNGARFKKSRTLHI